MKKSNHGTFILQ